MIQWYFIESKRSKHSDTRMPSSHQSLRIFSSLEDENSPDWKTTNLVPENVGIYWVYHEIYIYIYLFIYIYIYISNGCLSFNMFLALTSCKSEPLYKKMFFLAPLHKRWFQEKMNSLDPAIVLKIRRSGVWFLADYLTFSGPPQKKK